MPVTERTLRKWRKEALEQMHLSEIDADSVVSEVRKKTAERILRMTQELLDQHLLRRK